MEAIDPYEEERTNMQINTLNFNTPSGQIISLDDVDEASIEKYFLTEEQSRLKEIIWKTQNADYLKRQQQIKKRNQKLEEKKKKKEGAIISQISEVSQSADTPEKLLEESNHSENENYLGKRAPSTPAQMQSEKNTSRKLSSDFQVHAPKPEPKQMPRTSMLNFLFKK